MCLGSAPARDSSPRPPSRDEGDFFEKHVRPVLAENCFTCHGPKQQKSGLRLDSREAVLKGTDLGPVVLPGDVEKSPLVRAIRYDGDVKMPPKKKLPPEAIEALTKWVRLGAPWPTAKDEAGTRKDEPGQPPDKSHPSSFHLHPSKHWAFQPVKHQRPRTIDSFIRAKLQEKGLVPAPPADRRTLIRRATFDLLGLPPTPDEVEAFIHDPSPDAFAGLVDRLLASPHYGERWGRHWLDVARYADERGYVGVDVDRVYPFAYAYRDWVIRAFNEDLPYDQFLIQQLAADQLIREGEAPAEPGSAGASPSQSDRGSLAAMGFLTVGRRFINNQHDIIDDRIDVVTRGLMGLTVTCARCHDHKYDPIPTADYYSLYGVFASSEEPQDLPLLDPAVTGPQRQAFEKELAKLVEDKAKFERDNEQMRRERPREFKEKIKPYDNKIKRLHANHPGAPPRGMVLVDRPQPVTSHVLLRGNPGNVGPEVPRQFLEVLAGKDRKPFTMGSGRLELAHAIANRDNPLTARVLVNRVWLHHFGQGLVRTPSDFGLRSDPPSHPELLDFLAAHFMENGWSIKNLHRLIMLSSTYQQGSDATPGDAAAAVDAENTLLWKMNRQRLEFEALRDSLLFVSGQLDRTVGGRSGDLTRPPYDNRRTVYGFIDRQNLPAMFRTFDFANPDTHSPQRHTTTVPQQALFMMNSPFVAEQARRLVQRPEVAGQKETEGRVQQLHRLVYQRPASPEEVALARRFLASLEKEPAGNKPATLLSPWEKYAQVLLQANEFAFVD